MSGSTEEWGGILETNGVTSHPMSSEMFYNGSSQSKLPCRMGQENRLLDRTSRAIQQHRLTMKILKEGNKPSAPWWVGLKLTCDCGCKVELEEGDHVGTNDGYPGSYTQRSRDIFVTCPNCKRGIKYKSTQPWYPDDAPQWPERPLCTLGTSTPQYSHIRDFDRGVPVGE